MLDDYAFLAGIPDKFMHELYEKIANKIDVNGKTEKIGTYVISDGTFCKIGKTNNLIKRIKGLQTGNARKLILVGYTDTDEEQIMHELYADDRINGEWFMISNYALKKMNVVHVINFFIDDDLAELRGYLPKEYPDQNLYEKLHNNWAKIV